MLQVTSFYGNWKLGSHVAFVGLKLFSCCYSCCYSGSDWWRSFESHTPGETFISVLGFSYHWETACCLLCADDKNCWLLKSRLWGEWFYFFSSNIILFSAISQCTMTDCGEQLKDIFLFRERDVKTVIPILCNLITKPTWLVESFIQPIRSTTKIWVVLHHQYGISAFVTQMSICEGSSGDLGKHRLFSQAIQMVVTPWCDCRGWTSECFFSFPVLLVQICFVLFWFFMYHDQT